MSMTASIRVETRTASSSGGQHSHDLRIGAQPDYVDAKRSPLNSVPVPYLTAKELSSVCLERRKGRAEKDGAKRQPRSMKKDAAIGVAGIITFGKEAQPKIENLTPQEQDALFLESAQAVAKKLGTTLDGLSVHRDESAIHAHFQLAGYGLDGNPLSKKMDIKMCSSLQDIGARPFLKYGISRGEKIGDRIKRGDDYSKTIHRSVRQLHSDLPKELEAAQQRVAEMETKVEKTEGKLSQVNRNLVKAHSDNTDLKTTNASLEKEKQRLEKRLSTYQKRLDDREAELNRLSQIGKKKPEMKTGTILEPQPKKGLLGRESVKKSEIKYYPAQGLNLWFGGVMERAKRAKEREKEALEKAESNETELSRYRTAMKPLTLDTASLGHGPTDSRIAEITSKSEYEMHYSVIVQRTKDLVRVPPQKNKSPKQIAAALYRTSRDNFNPSTGIRFTSSSDEIAREIARMAIEDGIETDIHFTDLRHQDILITMAKEALDSPTPKTPEKPSKEPSNDLDQKSVPRWSNDETNPGIK